MSYQPRKVFPDWVIWALIVLITGSILARLVIKLFN